MRAPRGRWWKAGLFAGLILCVPAFMQWYAARSELRRVLADYERRGDSLDWREVVPPVPGGASNGKDDYLAAIANLPDFRHPRRLDLDWAFAAPGVAVPLSKMDLPTKVVEYPEVFDPDAPLTLQRTETVVTNIWLEVEPLIRAGETNWQHAVRASTNDVIDLGIDWSQGIFAKTPHVLRTRDLFSWIRVAVIFDLRDGKLESALRRLMIGWRLLKIHDEPELISALMRIAGAHYLTQATWELMSHTGWSEDQLANLQRAVDEVRFVESMDRAICQERCAGYQLWNEWMAAPGGIAKLYPSLDKLDSLSSAMRPTGLERLAIKRPWIWKNFVAAADLTSMLLHYHAALRELRAGWKARSLTSFLAAWPKDRDTPRHHLASRRSGVAFRNGGWKVFHAEMQREFLVTSLAIRRYRLRHRKIPASVTDLVPDFLDDPPVDWMDGKTLRYRQIDSENHLLWSVGQDGVDDGGSPATESQLRIISPTPAPGFDWVWPREADEAEIRTFLADRRSELGLP